jgi:hypothetical protein
VTKRFRVKGGGRLVELYKLGWLLKERLKPQSLSCQWRSLNGGKIRMHVAICYTYIPAVAIVAHK